ncbi:MAG: PilZ domain-containing protein [Gammaproteobacteria bacterium]|nr:PilZ domain-containing protein [Gammaproteobacteria bacterium]MBT4492060.1 PilZ domain-containing protein [Gammaproteobacteria bacterium]MBT7371231.1 PilZ domain-containing protein [Gammaproteobacteria bacterium]
MRAIERRAYLRISDLAHIDYRIVTEKDIQTGDLNALLGLSHTFDLRKQMYRLELEAMELRREISEMDRKLGTFLHNLNQRLELITTVVAAAETSDAASNVIELSPAGVSFVADSLYPEDTLMAIKLELRNTSLSIASFARVRYCLLSDNDSYRIGLQFTSLDMPTEALLERHISALQAEARRKRLHKL